MKNVEVLVEWSYAQITIWENIYEEFATYKRDINSDDWVLIEASSNPPTRTPEQLVEILEAYQRLEQTSWEARTLLAKAKRLERELEEM